MSTIIAFSAEDVCRLTGFSERQLGYWDKTGFFAPSYAQGNRRRAFGRIYSFRDVVALKTLALLRDRVPLQELRKVGHWLAERYMEPWARLRFYVAGRRVFFDEPVTGARTATRPFGQLASAELIEMERIAGGIEQDIAGLQQRGLAQVGQVVRRRAVAQNAWVIAGTRIPVSAIRAFVQKGYSVDDIIREYPRLRPQDIEAAMGFQEENQRESVG